MTPEVDPSTANNEHDASFSGREVAERAFTSIATELEALVGEESMEALTASGAELIESFQLQPELFDSQVHTLLFAAIAKRAAETPREDQAGQEFIADATMLLALQHSERYSQVKEAIEADDEDGPERLAVYEKFTNHELTAQMKAAIESGLLNPVRDHLGVTADNEDPYEVMVLELGDEDALQGMRPSMPRDMSDSAQAAYEKERAAYDAYEATMLANRDEFAAEAGIGGRVPTAWNMQVGGKTVLCLPSPTAKMLLDSDAIKNRYFSRREEEGERSDEASLQAVVAHEYAHTQGGVALDRNVFYGMTLEEYRVENASGNKHGYYDAKTFVRQLAVITGFDAAEYFDSNGKASNEHLFADMASVVGIDAMLEIALVPPKQYIEETRKMQQVTNEYLGGYDGVLTRLYETFKDNPGTQERVADFKANRRTFSPDVRRMWLANVAEDYQMPFVAELYKDVIAA